MVRSTTHESHQLFFEPRFHFLGLFTLITSGSGSVEYINTDIILCQKSPLATTRYVSCDAWTSVGPEVVELRQHYKRPLILRPSNPFFQKLAYGTDTVKIQIITRVRGTPAPRNPHVCER